MNRGSRWMGWMSSLTAVLLAGCQPGDSRDQGVEPDTVSAEDTLAGAQQSLYDRLGGETAIASVVDSMVAYAAADTALNFSRAGTANAWEATPENVALLKTRLVQFVGQATGGPQAYEGEDMGTVHAGMEITNEEFDRLGTHLQTALDAHGVPAAEQDELMAIVETTRTAIVAPTAGEPAGP
jgi:hemoglobin